MLGPPCVGESSTKGRVWACPSAHSQAREEQAPHSLVGRANQVTHENGAEHIACTPASLLTGSPGVSPSAKGRGWRPGCHWGREVEQAACTVPLHCLSLWPPLELERVIVMGRLVWLSVAVMSQETPTL